MADVWMAITVTAVVLLGFGVAVVVRRRREARLSPMERARRATRELAEEKHALRRRGPRGTGDHFGKTKIRKYGDDRHQDENGGDGGYSGTDSGGSGSSW